MSAAIQQTFCPSCHSGVAYCDHASRGWVRVECPQCSESFEEIIGDRPE